jgi:hypothetical protein
VGDGGGSKGGPVRIVHGRVEELAAPDAPPLLPEGEGGDGGGGLGGAVCVRLSFVGSALKSPRHALCRAHNTST